MRAKYWLLSGLFNTAIALLGGIAGGNSLFVAVLGIAGGAKLAYVITLNHISGKYAPYQDGSWLG